jgi:hypothetical protein
MNKSKAVIVLNEIIQKTQMIVGVCFVLFGIMGFCVEIGKLDSMDIFLVIFFIGIGSLLIYFSVKKKKLIKDFKTYVQKLSADPTGSISNLASAAGTSQDVVKKNLENMINKKFFVNAFIDINKNCIVFPSSNNINAGTNAAQSNVQQNTNQPEIEYVTVTCKSCGGINKIIKGKVSECDFCGSPISED